jgi:hypothetical protein
VATYYDPLSFQSSIQVLSPTYVLPVINTVLKTKPHGVIFEYWLPRDDFDAGTAGGLLEQVASDVEQIMSGEPVIAGSGGSQLDKNGLLAQFITFTVSYTPPGGTPNQLTADVDVPVTDFGQDVLGGVNAGLEDAAALIQAVYRNLQALAAG